jgi:hypothetical protein
MHRAFLLALLAGFASCRVVEAPLSEVPRNADGGPIRLDSASPLQVPPTVDPDVSVCPGDQQQLSIVGATLPPAQVGRPYRTALNAVGGRPPYVFTVAQRSSALEWLSVDAAGGISGVPMAAGPLAFFMIAVVDSGDGRCRASATATFEVRVDACAPGESASCFAADPSDRCSEGAAICEGGSVSACRPNGVPSSDPARCGPMCGRCDPKLADRCDQGRCRCGDGDACTAGSTCCAGTCVDLQSDPTNCGACGKKCSVGAHAAATCSAGSCASEVTCDAGWGRCDLAQPHSCDTRLDSDPMNCGTCGNVCVTSGPGARGTACKGGRCLCGDGPACGPSQVCCGSGSGAVCADLSEGSMSQAGITNCGACGNSCPAVPNADVACVAGSCKNSCRPGWTSCGGSGCTVRLDNDPMNCGACGNVCPAPVGGGGKAVCNAGSCSIACDGGRLMCGSRCVDSVGDPDSCGACDRVCSSANVAARACSNGACAPTCKAGFADCNGQNDGCETHVARDSNNCGACGNVCPRGFPGDLPLCIGGRCALDCAIGRGNCDGKLGCELDLVTDNNNCGACGKVCGNRSRCQQGSCACDAGWGNCDGAPGCESRLSEDPRNCGACGVVCGSKEICFMSKCAAYGDPV